MIFSKAWYKESMIQYHRIIFCSYIFYMTFSILFLPSLHANTFSSTQMQPSKAPSQAPTKSSIQGDTTLPWLTGPLIAPPGTVIQKGHICIQSYVYFNVNTGIYNADWRSISIPNFYSVSPQIFALIGLTEWMDFQITPQAVYNSFQNESDFRFGDLPIGFDFQLYPADQGPWMPGVKLTIRETFPTGHYQKLNPDKKNTDISGAGSLITNLNLVLYKVFHPQKNHYLSVTASFACNLAAPVYVKSFNTYGGGYNTNGKVFPGTSYISILSFEYTITDNWVLALDNIYTHINKNRFKGTLGQKIDGSPAVNSEPSSEQLSFAPAIEYNFSNSLGIIAGCWFSATGRNALQFYNGVFELNFTY